MPTPDELAATLTQDVVDAIGKTLAGAMEAALSNGIDNSSMPEEHMETAAWLFGISPEVVEAKKYVPEDVVVRVAGKLFRCSCGCNVFRHLDPDYPDEYTCNSCGATYEGV